MVFTRIILAAGAALCCVLTGLELAHRFGDQIVLFTDPIDSTQALAAEERWAELKLMTDFLTDRPDLAEPAQIDELSRQAETELSSYWGYAQRFAQGAATGEPTDWVSMLGSLSLDLFVIGDVRDLAIQGWKQAYYGSGDILIIALSAVGLTTTLAPHLDWAPALLKALKRSGALTKNFTKSLTRVGREAVQTGKYGKLSAMVTDVGKAARHLGPGPLRGAMSAVDSANDLKKVAKAAEIDAKGTYALTRLAGNNGIKRINRDGKNISTLATSLKVGSRAVKTADKLFGVIPSMWLLVVLVAALAILAATLLPRRREWSKHRRGQSAKTPQQTQP